MFQPNRPAAAALPAGSRAQPAVAAVRGAAGRDDVVKILDFGISVGKAPDFRARTTKNDGKTSYYRPELISGLLDDRNLQNPFPDDRNRWFLGDVVVRIPICWVLTTKT